MAGPLRFRWSHDSWDLPRVRRDLYASLDDAIGARLVQSWYEPPPGYDARRLEMANGDRALFAWGEDAFWLGNTQTPEALWRTEKYTFEEVPYRLARWAQRELLAELRVEDPWLAAYDHLSWFFLPVLFSKDGRTSSRAFLGEHAAGFPDATTDEALGFYERFLSTGVFDDYRYTMAAKLGTSPHVDLTRMRATMGEFNAAKLLTDAGHSITPEVEMDSGHALDFRVDSPEGQPIFVEVTRPSRPVDRRAGTPAAAVRGTAGAKTDGQLAAHPETLLLVDCSSFHDDEWATLAAERPAVGHRPAVVFRVRPDGSAAGYATGSVPLDLSEAGLDGEETRHVETDREREDGMAIRRLPAEEAAVRRYSEDLWLPYHRNLEATVESHALADDVDPVAEQVPWALEKLESTDYRIEVAVDGEAGDGSFVEIDAPLAGFVATDLDPCPSVFDRPDRVVISDIYVREPYRGTGLADDLVGRAERRADEAGCSELVLDVDVDNERALAFYERMGFEPLRRRLVRGVEPPTDSK